MPNSHLLDKPRPRRFQLVRRHDVNGMSGTGIVAEGIEYRDGVVAYRWLSSPRTSQLADSIHDLRHIHGHNGKSTVRWLDDPEPPGESKTLSEVYDERNLLALGTARLADEHPGDDYAAGWHLPTDADDADADEWAVVWATLPTGQVSWHVPRALAANANLPRQPLDYDGHTPHEKNRRIASFIHTDDV